MSYSTRISRQRRFGGRAGLGDDRGDALTDVPHDVVEHAGVVGIVLAVLVPGRRVAARRHVLVGEDRDDPGHADGVGRVDRGDARVGVRRAEHAKHESLRHVGVEREGLEALHDASGRFGRDGSADAVRRRGAGRGPVSRTGPSTDCVIASRIGRYPVQRQRLPFMRRSRSGRSVSVEGRGRHAHAGRAEPALEPEVLDERLLHGVQLIAVREPGRRDDGAPPPARPG